MSRRTLARRRRLAWRKLPAEEAFEFVGVFAGGGVGAEGLDFYARLDTGESAGTGAQGVVGVGGDDFVDPFEAGEGGGEGPVILPHGVHGAQHVVALAVLVDHGLGSFLEVVEGFHVFFLRGS